MDQPVRTSGTSQTTVQEFSTGVTGFAVIDRSGKRIGTVRDVNLGRTCILVETCRSLFGRKQSHAVHIWAVREIDLDTLTVSLAARDQDVVGAPEFRQLDPESETAIARYYYQVLTVLGESPDADP